MPKKFLWLFGTAPKPINVRVTGASIKSTNSVKRADASGPEFINPPPPYIIGFFELIIHSEKKEVEIAYFGILEEYQNKKLGSFLLSDAIKKSFQENVARVWLHTCSLDHKNALNNYLSRGMKIFKSEIVKI